MSFIKAHWPDTQVGSNQPKRTNLFLIKYYINNLYYIRIYYYIKIYLINLHINISIKTDKFMIYY